MTEEIKNNRIKCKEKIAKDEYDVFVSYNPKDEEHVTQISKWLEDNGIASWRAEWALQPGLPKLPAREQQIENSKSAAIFIGPTEIDSQQKMEIQAFLSEFMRRERPIIPVLLPNTLTNTKIPLFLDNMHRVDFRKKDPDPLEYLIWGITGKKPERVYRPGILIASLGDSPVIVSSMYDLLTKQENLTIDRVVVLVPKGEDVQKACKLVKAALPDIIELEPIGLDFEDADCSQNARSFLHALYKLLDNHEKLGDSIYLSLAGGRKSMAALMAWVAPLFPCVKKLYHIIDKEERYSSLEHFRSAYYINAKPAAIRSELMHPKLDQLSLVTIPFEGGQQIGEKLRLQVLSPLPDNFEEAEAFITTQTIVQQSDIPSLEVTKKVLVQFQILCKQDEVKAQSVRNGLLKMSGLTKLQEHEIGTETFPFKAPKSPRVMLRYFTGLKGSTRVVFYTLPLDSDNPIEQIVICSLEEAGTNGYKTLKEVAASPDFSVKDLSSIDMLAPVPSPAESVLIVPLGKSPMVATQLYTLLTKQEKHTIHEVVLIYPQGSTEIFSGAEFIQKALRKENNNVRCKLVGIPRLEDITNEKACRTYQNFLEDEIDRVQQEYPHCKIDLALSGGRKGMTAMTIFAAQKKQISYVYHTLVTDEYLSDKIETETKLNELQDPHLSLQEAYDRLFLRDYRTEGQYPYARFVLFRVPILPVHSPISSGPSQGQAPHASSTHALTTNYPLSFTFETPTKLEKSATELLSVYPGKAIPPEKPTVIPESSHESIVLYFSYADEDKELLKKLKNHLSVLRRNKVITIWDRSMIQAGKNENEERIRLLNSAHIILLLVSSAFIASEDTNNEAMRAIKLLGEKEVIVIPILCRSAAGWRHTVYGELRPLPGTKKAINQYAGAERDKIIMEVAEDIIKTVNELKAEREKEI